MTKHLRNIACACLLATAFVTSISCQRQDLLDEEPNDNIQVTYEYLYDCIWKVTDFPGESASLPPVVADADKALLFCKDDDRVTVLKQESAPDESVVYRHFAQYSYSIDEVIGIIQMVCGDNVYTFSVERLNDRSMTLYYQADQNEYVAYSRCAVSTIDIAD